MFALAEIRRMVAGTAFWREIVPCVRFAAALGAAFTTNRSFAPPVLPSTGDGLTVRAQPANDNGRPSVSSSSQDTPRQRAGYGAVGPDARMRQLAVGYDAR